MAHFSLAYYSSDLKNLHDMPKFSDSITQSGLKELLQPPLQLLLLLLLTNMRCVLGA